MKLIIIVVIDTESDSLIKALLNEGFRVTRIASTGGFLRRGSSTLLMGVEAGKVERAMQMVREHCAPSIDPSLKKVTIFVLKVDKFEQL
ncbi:MAG: hypothetical protein A2X25_05935 [Chloroflexi bacterium GWB2_49_20]|nr:MAG: hypothetical protein A2X25_05935 [Chloroflexi bacterium GWB2_49_20]OGN77224.1 MAG: hypothetical protein A2X26_06935 [Chloroflexi bacterium GWC2_49_37]OGN83950.1 MAG: hypothetical protein A2X27_02540 [Chloroflexi bacterium GWD2_49_16]